MAPAAFPELIENFISSKMAHDYILKQQDIFLHLFLREKEVGSDSLFWSSCQSGEEKTAEAGLQNPFRTGCLHAFLFPQCVPVTGRFCANFLPREYQLCSRIIFWGLFGFG